MSDYSATIHLCMSYHPRISSGQELGCVRGGVRLLYINSNVPESFLHRSIRRYEQASRSNPPYPPGERIVSDSQFIVYAHRTVHQSVPTNFFQPIPRARGDIKAIWSILGFDENVAIEPMTRFVSVEERHVCYALDVVSLRFIKYLAIFWTAGTLTFSSLAASRYRTCPSRAPRTTASVSAAPFRARVLRKKSPPLVCFSLLVLNLCSC
jgi:hypothetical protein